MKRVLLGWLIVFLTFSIRAEVIIGGDHAGNGGFTDRKGRELLKMASSDLVPALEITQYQLFIDNPEYLDILLEVLPYDALEIKQNDIRTRDGRRLMLDYQLNPNKLIILQDFFLAFAGTSDDHMFSAAKEVKLRLLHEASHLWGYNEVQSEFFSQDLMNYLEKPQFEARPTGFSFDKVCLCENGGEIPLTIENYDSCQNTCAQLPSSDLSLVADIDFPQDHNSIKSLYQWCFFEISGGGLSPDCIVKMNVQSTSLEMQIRPNFLGQNTIQVPLKSLKLKKGNTVKWSMISLHSTNSATSTQSQFTIEESDIEPFFLSQVYQYSCLLFDFNPPGSTYLGTFKNFFYFSGEDFPNPIPDEYSDQVICHDRNTYGDTDSFLYPRLEEFPAYQLWSKDNILLQDWDSDGALDINNKIRRETGVTYDLFMARDVIDPLWNGHPFIKLGYYLAPFKNKDNKNFCPKFKTSEDRLSGVTEYISHYIDTDTEPLFKAITQDVNSDPYGWLEVSLSQISGAIFTLKRRIPTLVSDEDRHHKSLFFYWPIDRNNPLVKKSGQALFKIESDSQQFRTSDKSFGCVPVP